VRVVLQRVLRARVEVEGAIVGQIGPGLVSLVGVGHGDGPDDARSLAKKTLALRIFADGERPFHRTVGQIGGGVLVVSQFTLLGDVRKGNRPSWSDAGAPELAEPLVDEYAAEIERADVTCSRGRFGAHMVVGLENDGPVTLVLDSEELRRPRRG
jgi:D-tyrosyl-tRNA(Tyr) deacylase